MKSPKKHGLFKLYRSATVCTILRILAALVLPLEVAAQTVAASDSAFQRFMVEASGVGKQTISFGSNGTPVLSPGVPNLSTNGGPNLNVTRSGSMLNPSGNPVPVTVAGTVPKSSIAPLLKRAASLLPLLSTGVAIFDLYAELGFTPTRQPDSTVTFTKTSSGFQCPTTLPNTPYYGDPRIQQTGPFCVPTYAGRDDSYSVGWGLQSAYFGWQSPTWPCGNASCQVGGYYLYAIYTTWNHPHMFSPGQHTATEQEVADAIASESGWPSSSKLSQAVADAQTVTGEKLAIEPSTISVTGPATSTGRTSTTTLPDGSTSTTTTTHNHTYQGDTITTSNVSTVTNNNPVTNITTVTTTTETPAEKARTQCEIDPQSLGCLQADFDVPGDQVPRVSRSVSYSPDGMFTGTGSCPADKVMTTSYGKQLVMSYGPTCDALSSYVRPVIVLLATYFAGLLIVAGLKQ
ncbi:MAG: hypothetical protein RL211_2271 [Pseudomonadota bacterium]|jgi:hypothetical protein